MKRVILRKKYWLWIVCILLFLVGCSNSTSNFDVEYYKNQIEELKLTNSELNKIVKSYSDNENIQSNNIEKLDSEILNILHVKEIDKIYYIVLTVKSNEVSEVQLWKYAEESTPVLLVTGIDIDIETRNQYLYCSVFKETGSDEYIEEVLKFDREDNVISIHKGKNVEISSSPDGKYFIIIENQVQSAGMENMRILKILDVQDSIVYDKTIDSKLHTELEPLGWNESKFWAAFNYAGGHPEFLEFDTETFNYEIIENKADYFESELNIRTGWICYSDFPVIKDIDMYNEFKQSNTEVNLFLYNLFTGENMKIGTSTAEAFSPRWINDYTLEYKYPDDDKRVLYELNLNH